MSEIKFFISGAITPFQRVKDLIINVEPARCVDYDKGPGELVTLKFNDLLVELLDQFHGFNKQDPSQSLFVRQEVMVETENGMEKSWAYIIQKEKLSDRQKSYILKLGHATGREVVPIDLLLYRELMGLELVIDKGRRLALSKKGQEVFRYLSS